MTRCRFVGLALSSQLVWVAAQAEGTSRAPDLWAETRLGVRLGASDAAADGGNLLELSPGFQAVAHLPWVDGNIDYALTQRQLEARPQTQHTLNARAQWFVWRKSFTLETSATAGQQRVSALQPTSATLAGRNQTQTSTWRIAPMWQGGWGRAMTYQLRHDLSYTHAGDPGAQRSDVVSQATSARVGHKPPVGLGWELAGEQSTQSRGAGVNDIQSTAASLSGIFSPDVHWRWRIAAGQERTNQLDIRSRTYDTWNVSSDWRPDDRTHIGVEWGHRYFGQSHAVSFEQRWARAAIQLSDTKSVQALPPGVSQASIGNLYDLMDAMYRNLEPDPVLRAQLVSAELRRRGLPPDLQVTSSFLTSRATLQRQQQAKFIYTAPRQTITLGVGRSVVSRLSGDLAVAGDDFDATSSVQTLNWQFGMSHRITPLASISLGIGQQRTEAAGSASRNGADAVSVSWQSALGRRTVGGLEVRHSTFVRSQGDDAENVLTGNLLHRF